MVPSLLGQSAPVTRTALEWTRLQDMSQWWHWLLFFAVVSVCILWTFVWYRRDARDLIRPVHWSLVLLRVTAVAVLVLFYLGLEQRTHHTLVKDSRIAILIDTSQSMGLPDDGSPGVSRIERLIGALRDSPLVPALGQHHQVNVYAFSADERPQQIAALASAHPRQTADAGSAERAGPRALSPMGRTVWQVAMGLAGLSAVALAIGLPIARARESAGAGWLLFVALSALLVSGTSAAVAHVCFSPYPRAVDETADLPETGDTTPATNLSPGDSVPASLPAFQTALGQLSPVGERTNIGDALHWILERERNEPLAAVVVISDGGHNIGREPLEVLDLARTRDVPIFTIGLGVSRQPVNVRIVDLQAPPRVFPGDPFSVTAYVQGYGLQGRQITVGLDAMPITPDGGGTAQAASPKPDPQWREDEKMVTIENDGEIVAVRFDLQPKNAGGWTYRVHVPEVPGESLLEDNSQSARIQIVQRRLQVLLVAGGPAREYHFLRNQLHRDQEIDVDVWLQTAVEGTSQDARKVLDGFPRTPETLFHYDCIVVFDPDWDLLEEEQVELLERWVAQQAGGLVTFAGPVHTARWAERPESSHKLDVLRGLYPVRFFRRRAVPVALGRTQSDTPWPLALTEEGQAASFLWLGETAEENARNWSMFRGIFGYYAVESAKEGATVYAHFSDPETAIDNRLPVYLASQFYGAGRVLYLGSGELWRLREVGDRFQERLYVQLLRFVSRGRLTRDTSRGILLLDRERCLQGEQIQVRAVLTNPRYEDLTVPQVAATVIGPDGSRETLVLPKQRSTDQTGPYVGTFVARPGIEGTYRVELPIPESDSGELLTQEVTARIADHEREQPLRNDVLLTEMAQRSQGTYYVGLEAAQGKSGLPALPRQIRPRTLETHLVGSADPAFDRRLVSWLLGIFAVALSLEWLLRRLYRLA